MKSSIIKIILITAILPTTAFAQEKRDHNLRFDHLAAKWDEAIPLGNGMLGALVWEKAGRLRLSLDRADLWDERKGLDLSKFNFKWVRRQVLKNDYAPVQKLGDDPYEKHPYPTKLPAAALEFDIAPLGAAISNILDIETGVNTVQFKNGVIFKCYVHALQPYGFFSFENLPPGSTPALQCVIPQLVVHDYHKAVKMGTGDDSHSGGGLKMLGYPPGTVQKTNGAIHYRQPTYENHYYEVAIEWKQAGSNRWVGSWTITSDQPSVLPRISDEKALAESWNSHLEWWNHFWSASSISLPDTLLEKQYYLEQYKLASVARKGAPAITLQAVWTADNGSLPPWKGDFHNDLNTQLSYWPVYTGNHPDEAATYTDWLWKISEKNRAYTKKYFGVNGLNVPGVATLSGDPMGGWIQYSLSPTVGAWCGQHFYWQWKFTMDSNFLRTRAYPYIHEVATYLEAITHNDNGPRKLPLSSSPEYNDNTINGWFTNWTNYDLALTKYLFKAAVEVSQAMDKPVEAGYWQKILSQLPGFEINETGLAIAPGQNLDTSHRHLSPYMAIYPLTLLDINKDSDKIIIENSLKHIEEKGTREWCGYTFCWMACLYARAEKSDSALEYLKIFASNFCSVNSFHLNGDQKGGQYSNYTYRPFTLEGNFAFAEGVQELLLQSREGYIEVFAAIPISWRDVSFRNLRTEGGFLVSAQRQNGITKEVIIRATHQGSIRIKTPADFFISEMPGVRKTSDGMIQIELKKGAQIVLENTPR